MRLIGMYGFKFSFYLCLCSILLEVREICDTTLMTMDWVLFSFMLPPHLRVIRYVFLLKPYFVITRRQNETDIFYTKLLKFENVTHSPISYT